MIQPLTIATFLLACGSGLYLYQSKHEVQLLDRTIERTVHETGALREQSRLLAAEWTMLNDPERLRKFSDTYLGLKTIAPSQFTSLADLGTRLPPPRVEVAPDGLDEQDGMPGATDSVPLLPEPAVAPVADEVFPVPPMPILPPAPVAALVAHPAEVKGTGSRPAVADGQPHTIVSEARPLEAHAPESRSPESRSSESRPYEPRFSEQHATRVAETRADVRTGPSPVASSTAVPPSSAVGSTAGGPARPIVLAAPRSSPAATQGPAKTPVNVASSQMPAPSHPASAPSGPAVVAASGSYTGSLLGMAHTSAPSAVPRPTPVIATYNAN